MPEEMRAAVEEVQKIIRDDLDYSCYFNLIPISKSDSSIPYGAQVMLTGEVKASAPEELILDLSDIRLSRPIGSKGFALKGDRRALAHRCSDWVVYTLTGEKGIARTRIAFSITQGGDKELGVVDYDGHNLALLTRGGGLKLSPDWSPSGELIAYAAYQGEELNLYKFSLKDRRSSPIPVQSAMTHTPAWSPDGARIAFTVSRGGNSEIYIADRSGRNLRRLTNHPGIDVSPAWSPTGRELAFVSDRAGSPQIYIVDVDGANLRRLTYEGSYNTSPAWSPKGDLILYVSKDENGRFQIHLTDLEGEVSHRLTSEGNNEDPAWSPDGLHIVFSSDRAGRYQLYTMHWDGTGVRRITDCSACSPTWSPRMD
jgi:TolB protein